MNSKPTSQTKVESFNSFQFIHQRHSNQILSGIVLTPKAPSPVTSVEKSSQKSKIHRCFQEAKLQTAQHVVRKYHFASRIKFLCKSYFSHSYGEQYVWYIFVSEPAKILHIKLFREFSNWKISSDYLYLGFLPLESLNFYEWKWLVYTALEAELGLFILKWVFFRKTRCALKLLKWNTRDSQLPSLWHPSKLLIFSEPLFPSSVRWEWNPPQRLFQGVKEGMTSKHTCQHREVALPRHFCPPVPSLSYFVISKSSCWLYPYQI